MQGAIINFTSHGSIQTHPVIYRCTLRRRGWGDYLNEMHQLCSDPDFNSLCLINNKWATAKNGFLT